MSVAPQLAVGTTTQGIDDTNYSVFQNVNGPGGTQLVCGNIFLGLQGYCAMVIPLGELAGLARGGMIENSLISAALTLRADGTWSAGGNIDVHVMLDDSPRAGPLDPRLAWKPPGGFGPDWRHDFWGEFDTRLEDTGGTPFIDTPVFNTMIWGMRAVAGAREQLAQIFTVPAGPSWSVARALLELRRFGTPAGSTEVAIQANTVDPYGRDIPDGVDLGVSAAVANGTVPLTPGNAQITFAFAPDVVLAPGQYWVVFRPSGAPWAVDGVNFIVWGQNRAFFNVGGAHLASNASRLSQGNYPGHVDVSLDLGAKSVGSIAWAVPAAVPGQTLSTPDLTSLVQEVILNSGHETASALLFAFLTNGETRTFRFRAHNHPSGTPPGFACQYRRRDIRGGLH